MTETTRHHFCPFTAGTAALVALALLDVTAGARLGIDAHETLISLARRMTLWLAAAGLAFVALRPLRPATRTGR